MCDRLGQCPGGQRGDLTGPNPVDRGKKGSKIHLITERTGLPISVAISAANTHDSLALEHVPVDAGAGTRATDQPLSLHQPIG
ncbi:hypothetical protein GCM10018965_066360 [Nonomuraea roseola]